MISNKRQGILAEFMRKIFSAGLFLLLGIVCSVQGAATDSAGNGPVSASDNRALAQQILADKTLGDVHRMALDLLGKGLNAGSGYAGTWIRDLNTFINLSLEVNPRASIRDALLQIIKFQGPHGDIIDGYVATDKSQDAKPDQRISPWAPGFCGYKNTVETDQESSLIQAIYKYIAVTHDRTILDDRIGDLSVRQRLVLAMNYVLTERFDSQHGLIWGGTTIDWGDVQPESLPGVRLDASSHRADSIYDNAMFVIALNDYIRLIGEDSPDATHWKKVRGQLKNNIRKYLWDAHNEKFIPHIYLNGSPFPKDFDENAIYYHGGTAVAIEAGLLSPPEVLSALAHMERDVQLAHAASIGLTVYPPYPRGFFQNPQVRDPYSYQNGGDWSWFGGRMIQQLIRFGYVAQAYRDLAPMVLRVKRHGDFYEWWTPSNQPRGSTNYRGAAGVLGQAIEMLQSWAKNQLPESH